MMQEEDDLDFKGSALALVRWIVLVSVGLGAGYAGSFLYLKYQNRFAGAAVKGAATEAGGAKLLEEAEKAKKKSNAFNGAILGATVAGALGLAVGIARGSIVGSLLGAIAGTLLGAGIGAGMGLGLFVLYRHFVSNNIGGMGRSLLMQLVLWGPLASGVILASLAAGAKPRWRVAGSLAGAAAFLCAAIPIVGAFVYTGYSDQTPPPVEHTGQLYVMLIAGCGILGGSLAWAAGGVKPGRAAAVSANS